MVTTIRAEVDKQEKRTDMTVITSKQNPLIKATKKLHQKKYRKQTYLIEGWHLFEEGLAAGAVFEQVFTLSEMAARLPEGLPVTLVSPEVLKDLCESPTPQGLVAQVKLPNQTLPGHFSGRYLLLEDVQDPGNVGTMIRTADAAGFDAVFISSRTADIYNLKTLRSMQGSHFHVPIYRVDFERLLPQLQAAQCPILATTLSAQSVAYQQLPKLTSFALVMGNEGQGISQAVTAAADHLVHIEMPGQAESLNVAVAAGIVMFSLL